MHLNRVTLIGFIGNDAEKKVAGATNIAVFSIATKTSWKNDSGSWNPAQTGIAVLRSGNSQISRAR